MSEDKLTAILSDCVREWQREWERMIQPREAWPSKLRAAVGALEEPPPDPTAPIPATTFPALHAGHCSLSFDDWWNDHENGCPTLVLDNDEQFARAVWNAAIKSTENLLENQRRDELKKGSA